MAMSGSLTEGTLDATKYNRVHALANSNRQKLQDILDILDNFKDKRYN